MDANEKNWRLKFKLTLQPVAQGVGECKTKETDTAIEMQDMYAAYRLVHIIYLSKFQRTSLVLYSIIAKTINGATLVTKLFL